MLATERDAKTVLWDVITAVTSTLGPTAMFVGPASGATLLPSLLTLPSAALAPSTLLLPCARLLFTSLGGRLIPGLRRALLLLLLLLRLTLPLALALLLLLGRGRL